MEHPKAGKVRMPGFALGDRNAQARVRHPPPMVGEHSAEVLGEFGFSAEEISALIGTDVVAQR